MGMYAIGLVGQIGSIEVVGRVLTPYFRPTKLFTDVRREGLAVITGLWLGNLDDNLFAQEVDAWEFSVHLLQERRREFFQKHDLADKPPEFIDDYLDENKLSMPDVPPLYAKTLQKDDILKLQGRFHTRCACSVFGYSGNESQSRQ